MTQILENSIDQASKIIGKTWPLYTFVASNPLTGYENLEFTEALALAKKYLNTTVFPEAKLFKQAFENGNIDTNVLVDLLHKNGKNESPTHYLALLESQKNQDKLNTSHQLDRIMAKWLAAYMDEGLAEWNMPFKNEGFYTAWRNLVVYDNEIGSTSLNEIPKTSIETLAQIMNAYTASDYVAIFSYHLASLPGWTGYINHRSESNSEWHRAFPIELVDYLAARLWTAKKLNAIILPVENIENDTQNEISKIQYIWLKAWEKTWQNQLVEKITNVSADVKLDSKNEIPEAQLVFCIDTRSELIRRNVESKGNYETFGYAGFFGIAMDYKSLNDGIIRKSCPPIVSSAYTVIESAQETKEKKLLTHKNKNKQSKFGSYFLNRMKNMLPSAFGFVELSGLFYGFSLIKRTFQQGNTSQLKAQNEATENFCQPTMNKASNDITASSEIPLVEKANIVKSAFDLMGWTNFAPLVLFVGHGSHTSNNPFGSSLDCGACAASAGRNNARMLAKLANLPEVRLYLANQHHIEIPDTTVFIGAEHNTTTDAIVLFDSEVPISHESQIKKLKTNLQKAQQTATQERLGFTSNSIDLAHKKANDWGETRPEWGLAKNAGFVIGSRNLTKHINLESRCFLHSYQWELDTTGKALEGIMQGPMVVTQWINNHYYFSTVDNNVYGGGTKITHNITGKFGVVQGNGGDLKMGLPLQSLFDSDEEMYHQPLRLSVFINAPITRVSEILERNSNLKSLLDNEWIYLIVMDPTQNDAVVQYDKNLQWIAYSQKKRLNFQKKN